MIADRRIIDIEIRRHLEVGAFEHLLKALEIGATALQILGDANPFVVDTVDRLHELEPHLTIWRVGLDSVLEHRLASMRISLGFSDFPEIFGAGDQRPDGLDLLDSVTGRIHGLDKLLFGPLLSHLAPMSLGVAVPLHSTSPVGDSIIIVGCSEHAIIGDVATRFGTDPFLQLAEHRVGTGSEITDRSEVTRLPAGWFEAALREWCNRLGGLLGVLTDPRWHIGHDGCFDPQSPFDLSLDIARLFGLVTAAQTTPAGHEETRRPLVFDLLDCVDAILVGGNSTSPSWTTPAQPVLAASLANERSQSRFPWESPATSNRAAAAPGPGTKQPPRRVELASMEPSLTRPPWEPVLDSTKDCARVADPYLSGARIGPKPSPL